MHSGPQFVEDDEVGDDGFDDVEDFGNLAQAQFSDEEDGSEDSDSEDEEPATVEDENEVLSTQEYVSAQRRRKLPRYYIDGPLKGHLEVCCPRCCRCPDSTDIGVGGGKSQRVG